MEERVKLFEAIYEFQLYFKFQDFPIPFNLRNEASPNERTEDPEKWVRLRVANLSLYPSISILAWSE